MAQTLKQPRSGCPINFGLQIFGDSWSLLILRDMLMQGKRSFSDFQNSDEKIASNILAERLSTLEASGLVTRERSKQDKRVWLYLPTPAGRALLPVLVEMAYWGAKNDTHTGAPDFFVFGYEKDRAGLINFLNESALQKQSQGTVGKADKR